MRNRLASGLAATLCGCALAGAAEPARIEIEPARLDSYAGYYQLGPRTAVKLSREETRLFLNPMGSTRKLELVAESPVRFAVGNAPITITFRPNADGSITEAIVGQGGRDIAAPRITEQAAAALIAQAQEPPPPITRTWATHFVPYRTLSHLEGGSVDYWPGFAPDGASVIFSRTSDAGKSWALVRVPAEGGPVQNLFDRAGLPATRASSESSGRLAFNAGNSIWITDDTGQNAHELPLKDVVGPAYPSWYPDGRRVAFVDGPRNILYRADISTGATTPLTRQSEVLAGMASVSPDGRRIAFAGQRNVGQLYNQNDNQIWLVDESGNARPLEAAPGPGRTPSWSPDGRRIAFESNRGSPDGHYAIFIIDVDGGNLVQVTDYSLNGNHPTWSPDGRKIVFSWGSEPGKPNGIAVIDVP